MIFIYKDLVKRWIPSLTTEHIKKYATIYHIDVSDEEIEIIYQFILKYYQELMEDEQTILFLKPLIREALYQKVNSLYQENKVKYFS